MAHKDLNQYQKRLYLEALIKSATLGLALGCGMALLVKFITLLAGVKGTLLSIIIGIVLSLILAPLAFFFIYKPDDKKTAMRVDNLGLDERVITMLQYQDVEDNYMVLRQRENTKEKLVEVTPKQVKLSIMTLPFVVLMCLLPLTAGTYVIDGVVTAQKSNPPVDPGDKEDDGNEQLTPDQIKDIEARIEELRTMVDMATISDDQKEVLHGIIDALVEELKTFPLYEDKVERIEEVKDQIMKLIDAYRTVNGLINIIIDIINKADISDEAKELLLAEVDKFVENLLLVTNVEELKQTTIEFAATIQWTIIEIYLGETAGIIYGAMEEGIPQERIDLAWERYEQLLADIEGLTDYKEIMELISIAKQEIIEILYPPEEGYDPTTSDDLPEVSEDIAEAIDDALKELEDIENETEPEPDGVEPDVSDTEDEEEEDLIPPPPPEGEGHIDPIIDGNTDLLEYIQEHYDELVAMLEDPNIDPELYALIEAYLKIFAQASEDTN